MGINELVSLGVSDDIVRIILRRPPLNFLNIEMLLQLESHFESLGDSPSCAALIVDSEGTGFCAGLDFTERTRQGVFLLLEQFHHVVRCLNSFPRPTVAIVRGMALGAGNELVACCDFVFGAEKAAFGQPEVKTGSIPSLAAMVLPSLIGERRTLEMILTGSLIDAKQAEKIGLISRTLPEEQLAAAVEELISTLRGLSRPVMELALKTARETRTLALEQRIRSSESLYLNQLMDLEDAEEGLRAFLEKRPPTWKHR